MDSEPSTVRLCFFGLCKGGRSFKTKGVDVERDLPFISGLAVWPLFYDFCTKALLLLLLFVPLAGRLLASYLFLSLFFWSTWERRAKDFRISGSWTCQYRFWSRLLPDAGHFPPRSSLGPPLQPKSLLTLIYAGLPPDYEWFLSSSSVIYVCAMGAKGITRPGSLVAIQQRSKVAVRALDGRTDGKRQVLSLSLLCCRGGHTRESLMDSL